MAAGVDTATRRSLQQDEEEEFGVGPKHGGAGAGNEVARVQAQRSLEQAKMAGGAAGGGAGASSASGAAAGSHLVDDAPLGGKGIQPVRRFPFQDDAFHTIIQWLYAKALELKGPGWPANKAQAAKLAEPFVANYRQPPPAKSTGSGATTKR